MLFAYELDRRLGHGARGVTVNAFDPGLMPGSGLARDYGSVQRLAWRLVMPVLRILPNVNSTRRSGANLAALVDDPALDGVTGSTSRELAGSVPRAIRTMRPWPPICGRSASGWCRRSASFPGGPVVSPRWHPDRSPEQGGTAALRRARIAVGALFLTNGAIFANLLPRYPEIKTDLHLSNAVYGAAVASFSGGALVAGLTAATLIRRFPQRAGRGDRHRGAFRLRHRGAGAAGTPLVLAAALFLAGASDSVVDVAQNAHGLRLQRRHGRSIINSLHAVWAAGRSSAGSSVPVRSRSEYRAESNFRWSECC